MIKGTAGVCCVSAWMFHFGFPPKKAVPFTLYNAITVAVCQYQSKKRQYDQEVENLERQQKQTIERLEQDHTNRLREEAKRIKAEQDKELSKYQNVLKNHKKQVSITSSLSPFVYLKRIRCRCYL